MERAVTSASNIFRRYLCPGSERLEAGLPEEDSEEAKEGTLLHKHDADPALERKKLKPNQRDLLEISEKLRHEVLNRTIEQFGLEDGGEEDFGHEREMWLHRGIKSLFPGHCDDWWYWAKEKLLIVLDKKFGFKEVTPANSNLQLRTYAVMGAELHEVENCVVAITQPRLPFEQRLTMAVYNRSEIAAARAQLYRIWDEAEKPEAPLVAGEEQCNYCKARLFCPARAAKAEKGLAPVLPIDPSLSVANREAVVIERLSACNNEQLERMHEAVRLSKMVDDPLHELMRSRIAAGEMPGWKLGKETEMREVTDVAAAQTIMAEVLAPNRFLESCKVSLTKLEEGYRDQYGATWKEAKDKVNDLLGPVIERHAKKPSVLKDGKTLTAGTAAK